jgi:hypothetical protein
MTVAAEQELKHIGETKGCADHDHGLGRRLDALWRYDQYIANAEDRNELRQFWRDVKAQEKENIKRLKGLIAPLSLQQLWSLCALTFISLCVGLQTNTAEAAFISTSDPNSPSEISARVVWTGAALQGSVSDVSSRSSSAVLSPATHTFSGPGSQIAFLVGFNSGAGTVSLSIDFNRDGTFSSNEQLVISSNEMPVMDSFQGLTFEYVSISVGGSNSSRKSSLTDLQINGESFESGRSGRASSELFFRNSASNPASEIFVSGKLSLSDMSAVRGRGAGLKIDFKGPTTPSTNSITVIPEPISGSMFLLGGIVLACGTRRFRTTSAA